MDAELQEYLAGMEERLMAHVEGVFAQWAGPVEVRSRAHSASIRAIETEMEVMVDRFRRGGNNTGESSPRVARMLVKKAPTPRENSGFTQVEEDVSSALFNLGVGSRAKADEATRVASAAGPADFETLFRRALQPALARPRTA